MTKIQLGSGASSSTTHRLTQSSHTIDRRNVMRPSNLAIEEAARTSAPRRNMETSNVRPSRLVNLRVHAADLLQAQEEELPPEEPVTEQQAIVPNVVEFGSIDRTQAEDLPPVDLTQMVPQEAPVEETSYMPAIINSPAIPPEYPTNDIQSYNSSELQTYAPNTSQPYDTDELQTCTPNVPQSYPTNELAQIPDTTTPEINSQELAMSIAADYAAANLGAVENSNNSIDAIAQATSQAIAAIRSATDPEEIAEQVASLQKFSDNIKATSAAPEMLELSNTIEKFIAVAMKSTKVQEEVQKKAAQETIAEKPAIKTAAPTTITKKPATRIAAPKVQKTAKISRMPKVAPRTAATRPVATRPAAKPASRRTARGATKVTPKLVADEDRALRNALRNVAAMDGEPETKPIKIPAARKRGAGKRLVLAFFCAVACVSAIVYFISSSIPDISVKVAALQTGIEASYPSYIPRDYSLSDISSEDGKITMSFKGPDKATFTLTEEKSSWDSTALLRNFVEPTWQSNYVTTHEQGITIYISNANAAWVNGGVLYKITAPNNSLTKKQLRNIVTSM